MPPLQELPCYRRLDLDVVGAEGAELILRDGRRVLDLYGGHCVNTLGAGDEDLRVALGAQWRKLSFATNLLAHDPRAEFLAAFEANLPRGAWSVFLSNSGAEANENALKAALAATGRRAVVCFQGAFHGRTAAAAAVSDTRAPAFPTDPFEVRRIPFGAIDALDGVLDADVAAVILEPIQSLAGVVMASAEFLSALQERCQSRGALLIFDEVQTGNGRLGVPFAAQYFGVVPDLFTTAKGAAGGLPIGVTVLQDTVAERVSASLFGSTFGGGPLVLAAAAVVARRIGEEWFQAQVREVANVLQRAAECASVRRVRGAGLLLGLELEPGQRAAAFQGALLEQGVLVGTSDDPEVARLSPPLTLALRQAGHFLDVLAAREVLS